MSDLKIKVLLEAIDKITAPMRKLASNFRNLTGKMKESMDKLGKAMSDFGSKISIGLSAPLAALGYGALSQAMKFEKLNASLKTVTGSTDKANAAFKDLTDFAKTTPFQLDEVVGSFIKLKALGLEPSIEAMKAYGNVSSAMGKSLDQFIEAIADASTGEFERLKEFGIKASVQGKKVTMTFQGQKTIIKNNAKEIESYLRSIGQVQFAGAMDEQMKILAGSVSNLADTISTQGGRIGNKLNKVFNLNKKINQAADAIGRVVDSFMGLPEPVITAIAYFGLAIVVLGPFLMILGQVVIGIGAMVMGFGMVAPALIAVIAVVKALSVALLTTPIGWIVLAIGALIGAGYLLIKNWDKVKEFFSTLWIGLKAMFQEGVDWVMRLLQPMLNVIDKVKGGINAVFPSSGNAVAPSGQPVAPTPSQGGPRIDTGGTLRIQVDSQGKASVTDMKPNSPNQKMVLDQGYIFNGAY